MIVIETASLAQLEVLTKMFEAYRKFYRKPPNPSGARQFLQDRLNHEESIIFIASSQGDYCGFTQLYPLFSSTNLSRLFLLNDLYVAPDYRNCGVGKALITAAKEHALAHNANGLLLETEKTNAPGNHLYPLMGFQKDEDHHYYFWEATTV